ncbi:putative uncharacterized protein DDB_G0271982 [Octopus bimaculoides]|uniref:putative uncharacterized protein DDB_G0271982 n=1 Tax=Octopus bimaculoides TaxID=37653 RepID=UPI00071E3456|nr:putative uncharacterized protein DDB_G0271982 [Octopus bimaculoides]|eukprot:XP_014779089.1 PREDICTED: putative uncharacterized protein DDB_G0271982 [Octopus bimaculoides]
MALRSLGYNMYEEKRKERVGFPPERQKKKKETDKEIEEEVVKNVEKEIEKEVEKEVEKEEEKEEEEEEETETSIIGKFLEVEQQREETATLIEMEEMAPRVEHGKQERRRRYHSWNFLTYAKNENTEKMITKLKSVIRAKLSKEMYGDIVKQILIDKEMLNHRHSWWNSMNYRH